MPPSNPYLPLFEITRGPVVESIHYGAVTIVDPAGKIYASYGDPQSITYLRSSAKPFQALPFYEHGGHSVYGLTQAEIALTCASHSGTDAHVETVKSIQAKTGVQEEQLMCGVHIPYHAATAEAMRARGETPTSNRHNCSGKHTGMLAYIRFQQNQGISAYSETSLPYIDLEHPLQQEILRTFAEMCELPGESVAIGIDGCSLPNFAVPMYNAALALAKVCDPSGLNPARATACRLITSSMQAHPDMVGGPDSFDTHLMGVLKERVICKAGAEGYQVLGLMPGALGPGSPALGIAIKVSDGDLGAHSRSRTDYLGHVRPAVALEVLRQLGAISATELDTLSDFGPTYPIHNWRKLDVGQGRPCFDLGLTK